MRRYLLQTILFSAFSTAFSACGRAQPVGGTAFQRAESAAMQHQFDVAEREYLLTIASDSVAENRARAVIALSAIKWRVHHDSAGAMQLLSKRDATPRLPFLALLEQSRMLAGFASFGASAKAARQALALATDSLDRRRARIAFASAVIESSMRARLAGMPQDSSNGPTWLEDAVAQLDDEVRASPGSALASRLLVDGAALIGNRAAMSRGWRSFYLIGAGDSTQPPLAESRRVLASSLSQSPLQTEPTGTRDAIIRALVDSRFFDAAAAIALLDGRSLTPHDAEIVAYDKFQRRVQSLTNEYYRLTALGKGSAKQWRGEFEDAGRALWPSLTWNGAAPRYDLERLRTELDHRFGAIINIGQTAGYEDLHMGHRVVDEARTVSQYGKQASLRFVALDHMVSNGFQTWAWDGRAGHGGWGSKALIVQVRPQYVDGPAAAWRDLTDSVRRKEIDNAIARDSASDATRARSTPVAYFASVSARMLRAGRQELYDSLYKTGLRGPALQAAFQHVIGDAVQESSIFAHEGRHSIDDATNVTGTTADKEFRAKLSEVAFAPRPRLALGGIISSTTGDNTPHGQANQRIADGLLHWMQEHSAEIAAINLNEGLLPQLPLLTNEQLRTAFRSMDALATRR